MASLWNRFKEFVGMGDDLVEGYEENDYSTQYPQETTTATTPPKETDRSRRTDETARRERLQQQSAPATAEESPRRPRSGNVIGMASAQAEVFVIEPQSFEDAPKLIQYLRERKSVVLNLTLMDPEQGQRTVDFVAGATYAIDGHQERLGDGIFLFTPSTVSISNNSLTKTPKPASDPLEGYKFNTDFWRSGT